MTEYANAIMVNWLPVTILVIMGAGLLWLAFGILRAIRDLTDKYL